ncbi:MAG TPA: hypothetical protein VGY55_24415 [Pirellulales bacterium]|nr:hypothetical protein [Pirellulales bacterium]
MTTCIYYDLEEVSPGDIQLARRCAPGTTEFVARGVVWPLGIGGSPPEHVPSPRDYDYQAELMDWIDRLFQALLQANGSVHQCGHQVRTLLEIARYHFFFEFAAVEQRWRALVEMWRRHAADRVIWVAPAGRLRQLTGLGDNALPVRIEFVGGAGPRGVASRLFETAKQIARPPIKWLIHGLSRFTIPTVRTPSPLDTRVVFAEYFPNSAKGLLPVAKSLGDDHGIEVMWLALRKPVATLIRRSGIAPHLINQFVPEAADARTPFTIEDRERLEDSLNQLPDPIFRGTTDVVGRRYLQPALRQHLTSALEQATYWLDALMRTFARIRPRCVVSTTYSSIPGRAAAIACQRHGGRSIYLQHGLFPDREFFTRFCNDTLLLWGESNRRFITNHGIGDEQVQVVGATIYDDLVCRAKSARSKPLPAREGSLAIAYMASRTGGAAVSYSTAKLCLSSVIQAASEIAGARLVVKLHPGDKTGMVERLVGKRRGCTVVKEGGSQEVICQSDVVIVLSSTTGLEACMADKPLIVLRPEGVPGFGPYAEYNAALEVPVNGDGDAKRIAEAIQSLRSDAKLAQSLAAGRRRLVNDMLNGGQGNAAQLSAQAIAALLQEPAEAAAKLGNNA